MALSIPLRAIIIAIAVHSLWGGNPVAVKFSLLAFPPLWTAFWRFAIAIVCLLLWAWLRRIPIRPARDEWKPLGAIAALFAVQIAAMNVGFDLTTAAMGAVLIATNPLFAVVFAHFLISGDRLNALKVAGLTVAMAGTALVIFQDAADEIAIAMAGNWIVLGSACMLGFRLALAGRAVRRIDPLRIAIWQMVLSLPAFLIGALLIETVRWEAISWMPIAGLFYQGAIVAGIGFTVSFSLMKRYTPSVMMSFNFVSPIAGVILSAWLLSEAITWGLLAGMLLVAVGLYLIAMKREGSD